MSFHISYHLLILIFLLHRFPWINNTNEEAVNTRCRPNRAREAVCLFAASEREVHVQNENRKICRLPACQKRRPQFTLLSENKSCHRKNARRARCLIDKTTGHFENRQAVSTQWVFRAESCNWNKVYAFADSSLDYERLMWARRALIASVRGATGTIACVVRINRTFGSHFSADEATN